jgi:hypothetical protein
MNTKSSKGTLGDKDAHTVEVIVCCPVWGDSYVETCLELALPSLLSRRNLPATIGKYRITWLIFTSPEDRKRIESHDTFKLLSQFVQVMWQERPTAGAKYVALTTSWLVATKIARRRNAILTMCLADTVWGESSFLNALEATCDERLVLSWTGILQDELVRSALLQLREGATLRLPHQTLSRLIIEMAHENQRRWCVSQDAVPRTPTSAIWVSPNGLDAVVRSHILGPIGLNFARIPTPAADAYEAALHSGLVLDEPATLNCLAAESTEVRIVQNSAIFVAASIDGALRQVNSPRRTVRGFIDSELELSLRRHQRWEPPLAREFFRSVYWLIGSGDFGWLVKTSSISQGIADRLARVRRSPNPSILFWHLLKPRMRRRIISFLKKNHLYHLVFRVFVGYSPASRSLHLESPMEEKQRW